MSVTSTRLLVTSIGPSQLLQFDAGGEQLRRVDLPECVDPEHTPSSRRPAWTFIVGHYSLLDRQHQLSEVGAGGEVLRQFSAAHLGRIQHVAGDSRGHAFVAVDGRVLLLDAQLALRRVVVDEHRLSNKKPRRLCYVEQSGQLLVVLGRRSVAVFDVFRR